MSKTGKILQVIGAVVDAQFDAETMPDIFDAIEVQRPEELGGGKLVLEVQQHLGDNRVRAVAMSTTDGLIRGMDIENTGAPISVPVGEKVLGRIFNVTGDPVDERGEVGNETTLPIHRQPPTLVEQDTEANILETGMMFFIPMSSGITR